VSSLVSSFIFLLHFLHETRARCKLNRQVLFWPPLGLEARATGSTDPTEKKNEKQYIITIIIIVKNIIIWLKNISFLS